MIRPASKVKKIHEVEYWKSKHRLKTRPTCLDGPEQYVQQIATLRSEFESSKLYAKTAQHARAGSSLKAGENALKDNRLSKRRNKGGRPYKVDPDAERRAQEEAQLGYLDTLHAIGLDAKKTEINRANAMQSRLYEPKYHSSPKERESRSAEDGESSEPNPWERAHYKQGWVWLDCGWLSNHEIKLTLSAGRYASC
jgi:hypothetical protein